MSYWISSDLDGTLFDHHDYSYDGANAGLARCLQRKTPIILNTSKTLRETLAAQQRLKLAGPIVVENGSALILPDFNSVDIRRKTQRFTNFYSEYKKHSWVAV